MYLGIEIGGTKLQLGVGAGDGKLVALERRPVDITRGGEGIREQIADVGRALMAAYRIRGVGYGFGGPLDLAAGRTIKSHQVAGWDDFPLAEWTQSVLGVPVVLNNDCDAAALAEARFGAGAGKKFVFYVTVGTGVGGGLVIDGQIYRGSRGVAAEIGHLRPFFMGGAHTATVEGLVAGPGIVGTVHSFVERFGQSLKSAPQAASEQGPHDQLFHAQFADQGQAPRGWVYPAATSGEMLRAIAGLSELSGGDIGQITAQDVFRAAGNGNAIASGAIVIAVKALGWAIAQVVTLLSPEVVVIGGGVSLAGEKAFFEPLRIEVTRYVFEPLLDSYAIVPAALGEEVVVHGAIAAACDALRKGG